MELFIVIALAALIFYKLNEEHYYDPKFDEEARRRDSGEPMLIDAWKGFGQILPKSGDPEQNYGLKSETLTIGQLQDKYYDASKVNTKLLNEYYLNPNINWKYSMFKGPSDEVRWPTLVMGSAWYHKLPKPTPYTDDSKISNS